MCFFSELQRVMYHWIFCIAPLQTSEIQSYSELSVHLFTGITVKMVLRSFTSIWKLFRFCRWISQMPSSSSHMDRSTWSQLGTSEPRRHMIVPAQCKVHHMINETDFLHMGFLQCLAAQCRPTLSLDLPKWRCGNSYVGSCLEFTRSYLTLIPFACILLPLWVPFPVWQEGVCWAMWYEGLSLGTGYVWAPWKKWKCGRIMLLMSQCGVNESGSASC